MLLVGLQSLEQGEGVGLADQPGEAMGEELGLFVDHHTAQALVVVIENDWGACVVSPQSRRRPDYEITHGEGGFVDDPNSPVSPLHTPIRNSLLMFACISA
ncbi:hypothetical protein PCA10_23270 [Metapseudomonas resinovorans NBRC 106553]|uniref:Uncharacterized protein n=1 Tax=Metapseudomonas resinovorans NBRC 106553 TaxID=1245471 RepID=S6BG76_METRE|nr:hypothetical protein PCA10_23270 [Pseudomonas resinovorans NBRC 106553]